MSGVNKAIILGRLGKDPEIRNVNDKSKVANFSLATSETYKNQKGEKVETTEWHNIVMWNALAEIAEKYLHKGDQVYIEGKIVTRSWEKDGITRYTTEIKAESMTMPGGSNKGSQSDSNSGGSSSRQETGSSSQSSGNKQESKKSAPTPEQSDKLPWE